MNARQVKEQLQDYIAGIDAQAQERWKINRPEDAYAILAPMIAKEKQEVYTVITLNTANEVINTHAVTKGLLDSSQVHPREVFHRAIGDLAASIITAHNHPAGTLKPSELDIQSHRRLMQASNIIGIPIRDNLIISTKGYTSFMDEGIR